MPTAAASTSPMELSLGAIPLSDHETGFRVWAPAARRVDLIIRSPEPQTIAMTPESGGYFFANAGVGPGATYLYRLDGSLERPDPVSRFQPEGVHGPSQVVSTRFNWTDASWQVPALQDYLIYELHVGTFSPEGTFDGVIPRLDYLKDLGVTAIELMPIAQFPGARNWGYDGVYPFAAQDFYGGPGGLHRLVNACHSKGLAVVLDVVYNHLGPEGNYLRDFGPYFTDAYKTPWGAALNFDGARSDEVRRFFIESAVYWTREFHLDAFRLDAVHAIVDPTAYPFLEQLSDAIHAEAAAEGRTVQVIAESSLNDPRLVRSKEVGGLGLDGVWNDDFHHSVHTLLTGELEGYYQDFGALEHLVASLQHGFTYAGEYSAFRERSHGRSASDVSPSRFVICTQNHDQVGNRMMGERLGNLVSFEALKLAASCLLLSPNIPLLFMGEEYGEPAPFPYFVSHSDAALVEAVRKGRAAEFEDFSWKGTPPDPQDEATFLSAKLNLELVSKDQHKTLLDFYRQLIQLRKEIADLPSVESKDVSVQPVTERTLSLRYSNTLVLLNFSEEVSQVAAPRNPGAWTKRIDSADQTWGGPGSALPASLGSSDATITLAPLSAALFARQLAKRSSSKRKQ